MSGAVVSPVRLRVLRLLACVTVAMVAAVGLSAGGAHAETITDTWTGLDGPYGVAVSPDGTKAYVVEHGSPGNRSVTVRNTATGAQIGVAWTGFVEPFGVAVSPDGTKAYVTDGLGARKVSVRNTTTGAEIASWTLPASMIPVGVAAYGTKVYVTDYFGKVSVRDAATGTEDASWTGLSNPYGVALSSDGTKAYVVNYGSNTVTVQNAATGAQIGPAWTGFNQPFQVAVSPDGATAYVTHNNNSVSVRNTTTGTEIASWTGFSNPFGVALSPNGATAYVANVIPGTVSVVTGFVPMITSADSATVVVGRAMTDFTVTTTGSPTATITASGGLPAGVVLTDNGDGTATIAGTPSAVGAFPITITAANGISPDATQPFTLTVQKAGRLPQSQAPISKKLKAHGKTVVNKKNARTIQRQKMYAVVTKARVTGVSTRGDIRCYKNTTGPKRKLAVKITGQCKKVKVWVKYTARGNDTYLPYSHTIRFSSKRR